MKLLFGLLFVSSLVAACAPTDESSSDDAHDHTHSSMSWVDTSDAADVSRVFEREGRFEQISMWLEGPAPVISARVRNGQNWSAWTPVEVTWSEDDRHVARLFATGDAVEFRGLHAMDVVGVELLKEQLGQPDLLTRNLPFAEPGPALTGAVAPASLVISRADWGARNPDKICGNIVAPYRISIHHTALPASDGGDPEARMRQMQAYHIDTNGWCDIGYHFVVSQSGNIYQGRSDERRPGAHVGNQNSGNVGISLIGDYSGTEPGATQLSSTVEIVRWVAETYEIPLTRDVVKGHREWPGQSTGCPGDRLLAQIDNILADAGSDVVTDVDIWAETGGLDDRLTQGTSLDKPDALPGDEFEVSLYLKNNSPAPIRDVELGYMVEVPYLRATNYVIESDAPEFDGNFSVNDADSADGNPAKDSLGGEGALTMYAFAAGETKRVRITLRAEQPSIGRADHPDVRAWVRNIGGVYEQAAFGEEPSVNRADETLNAFVEHDVLSTAGWLFDATDPEMLEGWAGCQQIESARVEGGAVIVTSSNDDPCIVSPAWAKIDADAYDQLVLNLESSVAPHDAALYWSTTDAETFNADRAVTFEVPAEGGTVVVDLSEHPEWRGSVERLRFDTVEGEQLDAEVAIGALLFQSSADETTSVPDFDFSPQTPVIADPGAGDPTGGSGDEDPDLNEERFQTNDGCAQGAGGAPAPLALLFVLGFAARMRRRR